MEQLSTHSQENIATSVEKQLRDELSAARQKIADLQEQLAASQTKVLELHDQLQRRNKDVAGADVDQRQEVGSLSKMQERLTRLRKEQADAEAMREAAWSELKAVVADISSLATVDNLQSVNIPRGP